ncbi:hypothetical protein ACWEOI_30715 [Nocardia sp. NPDC004340]
MSTLPAHEDALRQRISEIADCIAPHVGAWDSHYSAQLQDEVDKLTYRVADAELRVQRFERVITRIVPGMVLLLALILPPALEAWFLGHQWQRVLGLIVGVLTIAIAGLCYEWLIFLLTRLDGFARKDYFRSGLERSQRVGGKADTDIPALLLPFVVATWWPIVYLLSFGSVEHPGWWAFHLAWLQVDGAFVAVVPVTMLAALSAIAFRRHLALDPRSGIFFQATKLLRMRREPDIAFGDEISRKLWLQRLGYIARDIERVVPSTANRADRERIQLAAQYFRELRTWVLFPQVNTERDIFNQVVDLLGIIAAERYHDLPLSPNPIEAQPMRVTQRIAAVAIAIAPLVGVFVLIQQKITLLDWSGSSLLMPAVVWALLWIVVTGLVGKERLDTLKQVVETIKPGK